MLRLLGVLLVVVGCQATLFAAEPGDELVQMVLDLLADKDKDVRSVALEQIRTEAKGASATRRFAAELKKLSPEGQVALLGALADRGDDAARDTVIETLSATKAAEVRAAAILALGSLGTPADAERLVALLAAEARSDRDAARASLVRLRGESVAPALATALKTAPAAVKVALVEILAARRAFETMPTLLDAALGSDASVRAAAMVALGQLAETEQLPSMLRGVLAAEAGKERDAAERAVATVCGRITPSDKRAEPLLAAMEKVSPAERVELLSTLGRVGTPAALGVVEAALADPARHAAGLRALCNWPDGTVIPRLLELVSKDEHPEHRTQALAAVVRIAPLPDTRSDSERLELLKKAFALSQTDAERLAVVKRVRAIRTVESLRFLLPFLEQPTLAPMACESIVELAHHRGLREPNKAEFHAALDKVKATSPDPVVRDRALRYQENRTWARPKAE